MTWLDNAVSRSTKFENNGTNYAVTSGSYFPIVSAIFVGLLIISNVGATKLISAGPLIVDGGAFLFPLVYITGDVLTEVYGFRAARRVIFVGFAMAVLSAVTFLLIQVSPAAPGWENQAAFESILGFVPRIVFASVCGFLLGQILNSYVLAKLKQRTKESALWLRLIGSTVVGEFADTLVFCTIAFYGILTGGDFINYVVVGYFYKTLLEVVLLPITYRVVAFVKANETTYVSHTESI